MVKSGKLNWKKLGAISNVISILSEDMKEATQVQWSKSDCEAMARVMIYTMSGVINAISFTLIYDRDVDGLIVWSVK